MQIKDHRQLSSSAERLWTLAIKCLPILEKDITGLTLLQQCELTELQVALDLTKRQMNPTYVEKLTNKIKLYPRITKVFIAEYADGSLIEMIQKEDDEDGFYARLQFIRQLIRDSDQDEMELKRIQLMDMTQPFSQHVKNSIKSSWSRNEAVWVKLYFKDWF